MMMHSTINPPTFRVKMTMYAVSAAMLGTCIVATIGSIYGMAMATEGH